ncbi:hypothetical protein ACH427_15735 [Streptomyces sp. NPDC020379]|uniref:hypothetical protein n=1 Tax=Streptomyces sp. NPDC020379 TaxID=3365071 RepID=UPI0037A7706F
MYCTGGVRQELEAYLGIINVAGVVPGVYHYNMLEHSLELLAEGFTHAGARSLLPDQPAAEQAAFVVFVTAVLDRVPAAYAASRGHTGHDSVMDAVVWPDTAHPSMPPLVR